MLISNNYLFSHFFRETNTFKTILRVQQFSRHLNIFILTAHNEEAVFNKEKDVSPFAFIAKPIRRKNLERTISLAIELSGQLTYSNLEGKIGDDVIYT